MAHLDLGLRFDNFRQRKGIVTVGYRFLSRGACCVFCRTAEWPLLLPELFALHLKTFPQLLHLAIVLL